LTHTAFSYSRLNDYELCPRQFHEVTIKKSFAKETSPQMNEGKATHTALEQRVRDGSTLPATLTHLEPLCTALAASNGTKRTEFQMALDVNLAPTSWFGKQAYSRAIADLVIDAGRVAALFDYKTGKKKEDWLQLRLTSTHYFQYAPKVEIIKAAFIWTRDGTSSPITIKRTDMPAVWSEMKPRIDRYQEAFQTGYFPARRSWACRFCPVKTCEHNENKSAA
jgi:hypothetical protein